ncbi:MAG: SDR family oxidoreductase [Pseudomonadota bacterium]
MQQLLPMLDDGASIILLSSLAAHAAVGTLPAYAATKGAIDTLVKHFAAALGRARHPRQCGGARRRRDPTCRASPRRMPGRDVTLGMQALKRVAQPDDIGGVVAFLGSDAARWISGDTLRVDGGSKL